MNEVRLCRGTWTYCDGNCHNCEISKTTTKTIYVQDNGGAEVYKVCVIPDWQIEKIADAVVKMLSGGTVDPRYCDRNICMSNEYSGIGCDECEVNK